MKKTSDVNLEAAILKTSRLARLSFDESQMGTYTAKAQSVIKYVEQLRELNTDGIEPTSHAVEVEGRLRIDEVVESGLGDAIVNSAPAHESGLILVPRVIEGEE